MHRFRVATPADVDLIISIAREAYGIDACDWNAATRWVAGALINGSYTCLIGDRTVGFMLMQKMLWDKHYRAFLFYLFGRKGRGWEALALVRTLVAYAKSHHCASIEAGTETASDVGALLRRIDRDKTTQYSLVRLEL